MTLNRIKVVGASSGAQEVKAGITTLKGIHILIVNAAATLEIRNGTVASSDVVDTIQLDNQQNIDHINLRLGKGFVVNPSGTVARVLLVFS